MLMKEATELIMSIINDSPNPLCRFRKKEFFMDGKVANNIKSAGLYHGFFQILNFVLQTINCFAVAEQVW